MGEKKRHHKIPEFYLRGFMCRRGGERLWMYERGGAAPKAVSVKDATVEKGFYRVRTKTDHDPNTVENLLSLIESSAAPIHQRILSGHYPIGQEKADYSYFLATLFTRTSNSIEVTRKTMTELANLNKNLLAENPEAFRDFVTSYEQHSGKSLEIDTEELRTGFREARIGINPDLNLVLSVLDLASEVWHPLNAMQWTLIRNRGDLCFMSSDNPVCLHDPARHTDDFLGIGFVSAPTVQVTCPLSRDVALLATWSDVLYPRDCNAGNPLVRCINQRTVMNCERFVYAPDHTRAIQRFVNRTRPMVPDVDVQVHPETGHLVTRSIRRSD
jgi:hypothetical protein